jgi:hypothetical protein
VERAVSNGWSLKDATPYNIQFVNRQPVFIDIPSFEPLQQGEPWAGYRQFCEMFLFPLMLQAYKDCNFQPFMRAAIGGVDVQTLLRNKEDKYKDYSRESIESNLTRHFDIRAQQDVNNGNRCLYLCVKSDNTNAATGPA